MTPPSSSSPQPGHGGQSSPPFFVSFFEASATPGRYKRQERKRHTNETTATFPFNNDKLRLRPISKMLHLQFRAWKVWWVGGTERRAGVCQTVSYSFEAIVSCYFCKTNKIRKQWYMNNYEVKKLEVFWDIFQFLRKHFFFFFFWKNWKKNLFLMISKNW